MTGSGQDERTSAVELRSVGVSLAGRLVVEGVELDVDRGRFIALVGPNGSGKTTLLRSIYGALPVERGAIWLNGVEGARLGARRRAQEVAAMTQHDANAIGLGVRDVVALGRVPHLGMTQAASARDREIIDAAIDAAGAGHLVERGYATLSGGERQRVHLARLLAQESGIVLLDEPTNHLDIAAQFALLDAVAALDVTAIVSLHDLNHAAAYADVVVVMADGRLVASGDPVHVLTPELLDEVYGVQAVCGRHPITGRLHLTFASAPRRAPARRVTRRMEASST